MRKKRARRKRKDVRKKRTERDEEEEGKKEREADRQYLLRDSQIERERGEEVKEIIKWKENGRGMRKRRKTTNGRMLVQESKAKIGRGECFH